ncbi:Hypothetical predicted protein [Podarcis lilfordi]|uniref:Uncharacterized protein n=1 Tax=Podarcis lilfordi TaxID=74358 RepID=A0AA35JZA0_9SAUR|nr:Hypothetical predicted protein [Podarcis lilfordi]
MAAGSSQCLACQQGTAHQVEPLIGPFEAGVQSGSPALRSRQPVEFSNGQQPCENCLTEWQQKWLCVSGLNLTVRIYITVLSPIMMQEWVCHMECAASPTTFNCAAVTLGTSAANTGSFHVTKELSETEKISSHQL